MDLPELPAFPAATEVSTEETALPDPEPSNPLAPSPPPTAVATKDTGAVNAREMSRFMEEAALVDYDEATARAAFVSAGANHSLPFHTRNAPHIRMHRTLSTCLGTFNALIRPHLIPSLGGKPDVAFTNLLLGATVGDVTDDAHGSRASLLGDDDAGIPEEMYRGCMTRSEAVEILKDHKIRSFFLYRCVAGPTVGSEEVDDAASGGDCRRAHTVRIEYSNLLSPPSFRCRGS